MGKNVKSLSSSTLELTNQITILDIFNRSSLEASQKITHIRDRMYSQGCQQHGMVLISQERKNIQFKKKFVQRHSLRSLDILL